MDTETQTIVGWVGRDWEWRTTRGEYRSHLHLLDRYGRDLGGAMCGVVKSIEETDVANKNSRRCLTCLKLMRQARV